MELSPRARIEMEAWSARNRQGAHGEHSYTAEEFGLDRDSIRTAFGRYIEQFGL